MLLALLACKQPTTVPTQDTDATPVVPGVGCEAVHADLEAACGTCHGSAGLGNLSLIDLESLAGRQSRSGLALVEPGSPAQSYLFHKVSGTHLDVGGDGAIMPPSGELLSTEAIERLASWIEGGATCGVGVPATPPAPTTRRLSNVELANTLEVLLGVQPQSLSLLPPDGHGFTYDRVVASQTVSRAHLDAWFAIAEESAAAVLDPVVLGTLSDACAGVDLPPAVAVSSMVTAGNAFTLGPEWAAGVHEDDPTIATTLYAPFPTASASLSFPAGGRYELQFEIDPGAPVEVELRVDGAVIDTQPAQGPTTLSIEVDAQAGPAVFEALFTTEPRNDNLGVSYVSLTQTGPLDTGDASGRRPCAEGLVDDLGSRLFRRPVTADEATRLMDLYDQAEGHEAFAQVLVGMLASPHTLYLVEVGSQESPGVYTLDGWERAARLSYALCEQPPDEVLLHAASTGALMQPAEMEAQARRLLDLPCGRAGVQRFFSQWLHLNELEGLNKSPEAFPGFDEATLAGLQAESDRYVHEMVYPRSADLQAFFDSPVAWPDPRSAWLMGLSVSEQEETTLPPERAGFLTHPAVLSVTAGFESTSPVERGVFVLEQLMCDHLPPPPIELDITPPVPDPGLTTRERWGQHSSDPACASCHSLIDPVGFAFEGFDGIGQYRTTENGIPVDTTGGLPSIGVLSGELDGAAELSTVLAASDRVAQCFAKQWLRSSLGRLDHPADPESVAVVADVAANDAILEALVALVRSPVFGQRLTDESP